jgi:hypothetical protein
MVDNINYGFELLFARLVTMSNQVYSNVDPAVPYFGSSFSKTVAMIGTPGSVAGTCTIRVWKTSPYTAAFAIEATSAGTAWNPATQIDSNPAGVIPVGFRPTVLLVEAIMLKTTEVTAPPHEVFAAYIKIDTVGNFSVFKYNGSDGTVVQWQTNDQVGPCTLNYYTG